MVDVITVLNLSDEILAELDSLDVVLYGLTNHSGLVDDDKSNINDSIYLLMEDEGVTWFNFQTHHQRMSAYDGFLADGRSVYVNGDYSYYIDASNVNSIVIEMVRKSEAEESFDLYPLPTL